MPRVELGARRRGVAARGLQQVGPVHTGGGHLDQNLAMTSDYVGNLLPGQLLGPVGHDRVHALTLQPGFRPPA